MSCAHRDYEWPPDEHALEWRFPMSPEHPAGCLVQWCQRCGALRWIEGTRISRWLKPKQFDSRSPRTPENPKVS